MLLEMSLRMPCRKARSNPPMNQRAAAERQAVGEEQPQDADQAGDGEARHHGVADVLLAHHAAVEQGEARNGHHQHDGHRGQHPGGVAGIGRAFVRVLASQRRRALPARRGCPVAAGGPPRRTHGSGTLRKMASRNAPTRASSPARVGFLNVMVSLLSVTMRCGFRSPQRRFRRCGCAPRFRGRGRKSCRPRSARSSPPR